MNFKFRYFAIFVAFELGRIEAVKFQNDVGSSRRLLTDVSPVNEPTFSPVDVRIPISLVPKPSPSEEVSLEETEHVQIDLENSTHNNSHQNLDDQRSTPSMPPAVSKPIENELNITPEDPPTQGSNWCPTYFSGNGNECGPDLPSETRWIQCAYSEANHLQTCICAESDPFWRCKTNRPNSDAVVIVTTKPSVDSNTVQNGEVEDTPKEIPTEESNTSVQKENPEEFDSSPISQVNSTGITSSTPESNNTSLTAAGEESQSQSSSEAADESASTTPDDSKGTNEGPNPSATVESNANGTSVGNESHSQSSSEVDDASSSTPPDDSTGTNTLPDPSPPSELEQNNDADLTGAPSQASKGPGVPPSTSQADSNGSDKSNTDETPSQSTSEAVETSVPDDSSTVTDTSLPTKETGTEPIADATELPNSNLPTTTDASQNMSPSFAPKDGSGNEPNSPPVPMPAYKQTGITQIESPVIAPSVPPSPSTISLTQELPPGIFARRTAPPTTMPTTAITEDVSACRKASSKDRRILIFRRLRSLSGDDAFDDIEHAAFMAASWISDEDPLQLCPGDQNFTQRYVLALLYFYTSGDNWKRCARNPVRECFGQRFLSDFHECSWGGVTCDSQNRVTKLNLDENNMSGSIPQELSYLDQLFELDFDSNNLIGHFPSWVGAMKHLERLDLDRNILSGPIPEELYSSTSLKYVDMDRNILSGTISSNIGTMSQLVFFQVDFNQLIGTIPTEIANITDLQYFSVLGNGFDESAGIPFEICGFHTQIYANCEMCEKVPSDCCSVCLPADLSEFF